MKIGASKCSTPASSRVLSFAPAGGLLPLRVGKPSPQKTLPNNSNAAMSSRHTFPGLDLDMYRMSRESGMTLDLRPPAKQDEKSRLEKGLAVDLLRDHLPKFLKEEGPMDIYSENVVFVDGISPHLGLQPVTAKGKGAYSSLLWSLRFHCGLFCSDTKVKILRFWQPSPDLILARWEITLYPRVLNGVYGTKMAFDGTSEFSFNQAGKICGHRVDILNTDGLRLNLHFLLQRNTNYLIPTC